MNQHSPSAHTNVSPFVGLSASALAKAIFRADIPEEYVRSLPAQSLFLAAKTNGLESSLELLQMSSVSQYQIFLDLEFWHKDQFNEENFWNWASICEQDDSLEALQKFLGCSDLKIISWIISQYVHVVVFDDPTELPPSDRYYTPDKGHTWLGIKIEDPDRHRLLGKILALLFETSVELFYQVISIPNVSTNSILEEEAYQDRNRRLLDEGIPDLEIANKVTGIMNEERFLALVNGKKENLVSRPATIHPLVYELQALEPLTSLFDDVVNSPRRDEFEAELSLLMNSSLVRWFVQLYDTQEISELSQKVRGALNIGIEKAVLLTKLEPLDLYDKVGLTPIFQLGLKCINDAKIHAKRMLPKETSSSELVLLQDSLSQPFPQLPLALSSDGKWIAEDGKISSGFRPFSYLKEIEMIRNYNCSQKE